MFYFISKALTFFSFLFAILSIYDIFWVFRILIGGIVMLFLVSSGPDIPKIFHDSLIKGLINGAVLFWNAGGWILVVLAVLGILVGRIQRKRRRY